jgi:hypothetical protein
VSLAAAGKHFRSSGKIKKPRATFEKGYKTQIFIKAHRQEESATKD